MNSVFSRTLLLLSLLIVGMQLKANNKLVLPKSFAKTNSSKINKLPPLPMLKAREANSFRAGQGNKVLVLMVDFVEDDNPSTTGNGKFDLRRYGSDDYDYPISIGAPPHNNEYFRATMAAVRYYYLAASYGQFDIQYDIFPKNPDKVAYTLPNKMEYYNPGVNTTDFVLRTEEYFKHAFEEADKDPEIAFRNYDHYIIIHAGSDWQRDTKADSPNDLPTMHVSLRPAAQVLVDDGNTKIAYAISVPETITQDGGYGVTTANICHEFGHALGLIDLYNTYNHRPMVGYWDIMDSGGSIPIGLTGQDPETGEDTGYNLEGFLPTLPGAYSKTLLWGEDFLKEKGILKEVDMLELDKDIEISPAGFPNEFGRNTYIVKVPISENEYLLIENRQVDSDGDGGTSLVGALAETPDADDLRYRAILFPSPLADEQPGENAYQNYEYDYLLPGWTSAQNEYYGGGLVIWHINNDVIHSKTITNSDGELISKFDNNTVNTAFNNLGVKLIEADNYRHIGNPYVGPWWGTAYEPFYKDKPLLGLDTEGEYTIWQGLPTVQPGTNPPPSHNNEYSALSAPKNIDQYGNAGIYRIYDISNVPFASGSTRKMTFKIGYNNFATAKVIPEESYDFKSGKIIETVSLNPKEHIVGDAQDVMAITADSLFVFLHQYQQETDSWDYFGINRPFTYNSEYGLLTADVVETGGEELISVNANKLNIDGFFDRLTLDFNSEIGSKPIVWDYDGVRYLVVSSGEKTYIKNCFDETFAVFDFASRQLCPTSNGFVAITEDKAYFINSFNIDEAKKLNLPENTIFSNLVYYHNTVNPSYSFAFAKDHKADVWKFTENGFVKIFANTKQALSTNLAIGYLENKRPFLTFGIEDKAYGIYFDGSNVEGFPYVFEDKTMAVNGQISISYLNNQSLAEKNPFIYYPTKNGALLAFSLNTGYEKAFSFVAENQNAVYKLYYEKDYKRLYLNSNNVKNGLRTAYNTFDEVEEDFNPIIWADYINNQFLANDYNQNSAINLTNLKVTAYPNPARSGFVRIRLENNNQTANLKIYDIAGNILQEISKTNPENNSEFLIDTSKYASGVYYAVVKTKLTSKKVAFVIEK